MSSQNLYLCVDCGATKTSAVISDATGQIVGRALGGPSNFSYLGLEAFIKVLKVTVQQALYAATLSSTDVESLPLENMFVSVWIGVSGVDSPNDIRTLTNALCTIFAIPPSNRLQVTNDGNLLASPLNTHKELNNAVAVIAGTGSVVVSFERGEVTREGPTPLKEVARIGGWGWILGDLGSSFEISKETIREILTRADRRTVEGAAHNLDANSLEAQILTHFGIDVVVDLFRVIYAPDPLPSALASPDASTQHPTALIPRERRLTQLTPLIFEAAFKNGDELAFTVIKRCAAEFASLIANVLTTVPAGSPNRPRYGVEASSSILCLGGSLLGVTEYRDLILTQLAKLGHVFAAVEFVGNGDVAAAVAKGLALAEASSN